MKKNEQERIFILKRLISSSPELSFMLKLSDSELLLMLNSAILPNSISQNNLKYTLFSNLILNEKDSLRNITKFTQFKDILDRSEKDIFKFGLFYGFNSYNSSYQFSRFLKTSSDISEGELQFKKKVSSHLFESIFDFMYKIIFKGEKNGQFPRI